MNSDNQNIEWIVAEVLRRLEQLADAPAGQQQPPKAAPKPPAKERSKPNGRQNATDLVVDARVVSLTTIGGRLAGKKRLVVRPGAVVTPSVRDELRKRGLKLERSDETEATENAESELVVMVSENAGLRRIESSLNRIRSSRYSWFERRANERTLAAGSRPR